ncbi:hypothetical protein, partial [Pseudonocardia sp.]|uniref:hypothetical protein n=1 Tax=Pseudonocardia sp. TaxID=60912 RepID=UPI0031FDEB24
PEAMRAQGTAALLRRFANSTGFEAVDSLKIAEIADREQERAFARFTVDGRDWFVGFLFFPGGAVLATANVAEGDEATFREGEKNVAMIAPAPRRGLFRRR